MDEQVRVKVVFRQNKGTYVLRWRDPETGAEREQSAKTKVRKEADRQAGELRADLRDGRYAKPSKVHWEDFRLRFESEKLPSLAKRSQSSYRTALNAVEKLLRPTKLIEVNAAALSRLQKQLRTAGVRKRTADAESGVRESTIAMYLRHIKAALRWARKVGLPAIEMPKRARKQRQMRGRPITAEEYERMIAACEKERPDDAGVWKAFLEGLWLSGLRLGEALSLSWDVDATFGVEIGKKFVFFLIDAEAEKGFEDRRLSMTPDFAEFLLRTPLGERVGKVFGVSRLGLRLDEVSKIITAIGKRANVVVNKEQGKYASAHDLRRAFGTRWSARLKPVELQQIMRHASIETTLKYYVRQDAETLAASLWKAGEQDAPGQPSDRTDTAKSEAEK